MHYVVAEYTGVDTAVLKYKNIFFIEFLRVIYIIAIFDGQEIPNYRR